MRAGIAGLIILSLINTATAAEFPSELAAHPDKYDGKHVTVKGYVVIGPEARNIFDSKPGRNDPKGSCLGLGGPDTMFAHFHERATRGLSGTFRRGLCGSKDICLFWCSSSGIELDGGNKP